MTEEEINSERVELLENFYVQYTNQEKYNRTKSLESLGLGAAREALEEHTSSLEDNLPEYMREYDVENLTKYERDLLEFIRRLEKRVEILEQPEKRIERGVGGWV